MTTSQVCELANRGARTVFNWEREGLLHPVRVCGQKLYDPDEVETLLGITQGSEIDVNTEDWQVFVKAYTN